MKKKISFMLCILLLVFSFTACSSDSEGEQEMRECINFETVKATWITCFELEKILGSANEDEAKTKLDTVFGNLEKVGINTVFVHTRAFSDAIYDSEFFPRSEYLPENSTYDALKLMTDISHEHNISFHAWINPYRVSSSGIKSVSKSCPARKWYDKGYKDRLIICSTGVYYNPADINAQKLIINGVREICENYEVDGIHFDDYFYPTVQEDCDKASFETYKANYGHLSLKEYRTQNVSALVAGVYECVKSVNNNIQFGVSPQAIIANNENGQYADVTRWLSDKGYVDYICPQIYFGFLNESAPFEQCLNEWGNLPRNGSVKLLAGLALYKSGQTDKFASDDKKSDDSPYFEWKNNSDIIARQMAMTEQNKNYSGYAVYSYSYLTTTSDSGNLAQEVKNIEVEMNRS